MEVKTTPEQTPQPGHAGNVPSVRALVEDNVEPAVTPGPSVPGELEAPGVPVGAEVKLDNNLKTDPELTR